MYQEQYPSWQKVQLSFGDNLEVLQQMKTNSIDVVYFDFMFNETIEKSTGLKVIKSVTANDGLTKEHLNEALRVAKQRVVVKSSYGNQMIHQLGLKVYPENKQRRFHYGVYEVK
jgi:hypothetical protein